MLCHILWLVIFYVYDYDDYVLLIIWSNKLHFRSLMDFLKRDVEITSVEPRSCAASSLLNTLNIQSGRAAFERHAFDAGSFPRWKSKDPKLVTFWLNSRGLHLPSLAGCWFQLQGGISVQGFQCINSLCYTPISTAECCTISGLLLSWQNIWCW